MSTDPSSNPFVGMPPATLSAMLDEAVAALHTVVTGRREVTVKYAMGDGERSVTFKPANANDLHAHIRQLREALHGTRRRAIG